MSSIYSKHYLAFKLKPLQKVKALAKLKVGDCYFSARVTEW